MELIHNLRLCTFNCRSTKNTMVEVKLLCDSHDVVLIKEHWLLPCDLHCLGQTHTEYLAYGTSAVDIGKDILVGKPYGGTAVLYRKSMGDYG